MTAHLYFVAPGALSDDMAPGAPVVLAGDEGRHAVTVKRMGVGEQILLADGEGLVAHAVVAATTRGAPAIARAANTIVRWASIASRVWWNIGRARRSVLDIRKDCSTCHSS